MVGLPSDAFSEMSLVPGVLFATAKAALQGELGGDPLR